MSLTGLLDRYLKEGETDGKPSSTRKRWMPVFADLCKHLGHDDARRLTSKDVREWLDARSETLAPKTLNDVYFAALPAVMRWALTNKDITTNPTLDVKRRKGKRVRAREKGFTDSEAKEVLKVALKYEPKADARGNVREFPQMTAAKRWTPWLAAFSGARIAELTQLRKSDIREVDGMTVMRITPEAGSVKSNNFRDVPLHKQLIDLGFLDFVAGAPSGPLFYRGGDRDAKAGAQMAAGRVSEWLQEARVIPEGLQPTHAWRHRLKTLGC